MLSMQGPLYTAVTGNKSKSLARHAANVAASRSASLIIPRLYLSNYRIAADEEELESLGVTHVVSVIEYPPEYRGSYKTLHIHLQDSFMSDILQHLDTTTEFIKSALAENETNKVLVHCMMGVSRSATVVCAYLVATTPMIAAESIKFVAEKRSIVCPNMGFRRQLEEYALRFHDKAVQAKEAATNHVPNRVEEIMKKLKLSQITHRKLSTKEKGKPGEEATEKS